MIRTAVLLLCVLTGAVLSGCSSIPERREPPSQPSVATEALPFTLCLAPIRITVPEEEEKKGHDLPRLADTTRIAEETRRWIAASGAFAGVRVAEGEESALSEAWRHREDLLLDVTLNHLSTPYEGHNGWWGPNLLVWGLLMVPAWFVATEEYALSFTAEWTLTSVDSGRVLAKGQRDVRVTATLDEMDRGWQLLGFVEPDNDAENWRAIAELLLHAGRAEAAAAVTEELLAAYVPKALDPELRARMKKTMALVVGVSDYGSPLDAPPLPYAATDAKAVAQTLKDRLGIHERHLTLLLDRAATKDRVSGELEDMRRRARPGDQLVVYFAGYGTRNVRGEPVLLLCGADPADAGSLSLGDMASLLRGIEGESLILLDCSFDGSGRSIRGGDAATEGGGTDLVLLSSVASAILAADEGDDLVTPEQVRASLFAFHLLRSLRGEADREPDGVLTPSELYTLVRENVVADAAFFGKRQRPVAAGLERPVALRLMPAVGQVAVDGGTKP